jgi:Rad3-related DNA helicase
MEEKMVDHSQIMFTKKGLERVIPWFQFPAISKKNEFEVNTWLPILDAIASDVTILLEINANIRDLKKNGFVVSASDVDFTFADMINKLKFVAEETKSEYKKAIYDFIRSPRMTDSSSRFHDTAYDAALNLAAKLQSITEQLRKAPEQWVIRSVIRDGVSKQVVKVEITPLDISEKLAVIFEKGERVLFMSATILSKENFCKTLGLKENEANFVQVSDSDFPVANRPIYTLDVASLNYNTMSTELPKIARAVDQLMSLHSDEKGIIHVTRYDNMQYIRDNISSNNRQRLLATSKGGHDGDPAIEALGREELMRKHAMSNLPDMNDRWIAKKMKVNPKWYSWQAVLKLTQMYGRSIRSKEDHAKTYILDGEFHRLFGKASEMFPKWFKEAVSSRAAFETQLT